MPFVVFGLAAIAVSMTFGGAQSLAVFLLGIALVGFGTGCVRGGGD